jgi:S-DNA-T family DNA segregation ATPase FtsK/SpoIIIE
MVVRRAAPQAVVTGIALRRSPLRDAALDRLATTPEEVAAVLDPAAGDGRPQLVLIDDADSVDDFDGTVARLLALSRPDLHVVAAGRPDALRSLFTHWTVTLRRSRTGLLLRPEPALDGDMVGATLPRTPVGPRPGRGYVCDGGGVELVQAAWPPAIEAAAT